MIYHATCVSDLSIAETKYLRKSTLKDKGLVLIVYFGCFSPQFVWLCWVYGTKSNKTAHFMEESKRDREKRLGSSYPLQGQVQTYSHYASLLSIPVPPHSADNHALTLGPARHLKSKHSTTFSSSITVYLWIHSSILWHEAVKSLRLLLVTLHFNWF